MYNSIGTTIVITFLFSVTDGNSYIKTKKYSFSSANKSLCEISKIQHLNNSLRGEHARVRVPNRRTLSTIDLTVDRLHIHTRTHKYIALY